MSYFVDTNLCGMVPNDASLQQAWGRATTHFTNDKHAYVICPLVLLELFSGLANPEPSFFRRDLARLAFLAGKGERHFLEFPGAFVLGVVLGSRSPIARFNAADFDQWLQVALNAGTRTMLIQGHVQMYRSKLLEFGLDLEKCKRQHDDGLQSHIETWERRSLNKEKPPTGSEWAAAFLYSQGIIYQPPDLLQVTGALDAAYHYDLALYNSMTGYNFRSEKNAGDRIDRELLFYLCDPDVHIVTADARLRRRVAGSKQVSRIHLLSEF